MVMYVTEQNESVIRWKIIADNRTLVVVGVGRYREMDSENHIKFKKTDSLSFKIIGYIF